jgi:hypothetical protein
VPAASHLAALEVELAAVIREQSDRIAHRLALVLVELAVNERRARNGDGHVTAPRLCAVCRVRLAADQRTVCHSCRGVARRERERLRQKAARQLADAANGHHGERARELVTGLRTDPADPLLLEEPAP